MADNNVVEGVVVEGAVAGANAEARTRRSPDLKDKVIEFNLSKEMRLADLVEAGYQRREVEALFVALEEAGMGVFEAGRLGRGCSAKFTCNDGFPQKYTITMQVRRLRQDYIGKPVVEEKPAESVIMNASDSWLANDGAAQSNDTATDVQATDAAIVADDATDDIVA